MFNYYLQLGLMSLKRNPILTALMVFGIALGIAASMTTLTVLHLMSSDPIPWKSDKLHYVQLDNWDPNQGYDQEGNPPDQVTYRDAQALMEAAKADKQAAMYQGLSFPIQPENPEVKPFQSPWVAPTYADFFTMFEPPLQIRRRLGSCDQDSRSHARVVVLSKRDMNEKLFGGQDITGKIVRMNGIDYNIVGVLDDWKLRSRYYDLTIGAFSDPDEFFMPFTTARSISKQCASGNNQLLEIRSGDGWMPIWHLTARIQMWVQLDSPARLAEYKSFLDSYVGEQKKLGRFPRPLNNRLLNVTEWMRDQKVVSRDVEVQTGLAFAFLVVCLVNTIGLLLAKFMRKSAEIGLRRALGASRREVFTPVPDRIRRGRPDRWLPRPAADRRTRTGRPCVRLCTRNYQDASAQLDWSMVAVTVVLAIVSALLAGLYPTWRACRVQPAAQLKV